MQKLKGETLFVMSVFVSVRPLPSPIAGRRFWKGHRRLRGCSGESRLDKTVHVLYEE